MAATRTPLWTAREAAKATWGHAVGEWTADGVSIDSREIGPGDLFVAIKGPKFDGHDFAADALRAGASAVVVERVPAGLDGRDRLLVVENTMQALEELGRAARARTAARVVAVTGSVGKTGTKTALAHVLGAQGATHASGGNFNNQWGVPLSLARTPRDSRFAVYEIGMNHAGEIEPLTRMVRPHAAVIVNVEAVHLEFFPSVEAIADAKAEIFAGVESGGTAVIGRDGPHYQRLRKAAEACGITDVIDFGSHAGARARLLRHDLGAEGSAVEAELDGRPVSYRLGVAGKHWVMNSLAVLAAASALGADVEQVAADFATLVPPAGRGRRETIGLPGGGSFDLVDESYNASPPAMRVAIETLGRSPAEGRRIAVLGDMLELGPTSPALHAAVGPELGKAGIDLVFVAGTDMAQLWSVLPEARRGAWRQTSAELAPAVTAAVRAGDIVMVKGSHGSRMDVIVRALRALGGSR